jgi:hypothetical protein
MAQREDFLKTTLPRLLEADTALQNGDARLRSAMWSHNDPVTVFGAVKTSVGWMQIGPDLEWLQSRFSNCESFDYEVIAADASGDLAYIVGIEHTTASVDGAHLSLLPEGHCDPPSRGRRLEGRPQTRRSATRQLLDAEPTEPDVMGRELVAC